MFPSEPSPSFTCFNKLPTELRLFIWEWATLAPRIVHLSRKRLAVDPDPNWWRAVRSDKAIDGPEDDNESDYGSVDGGEDNFENLELLVAKQRLLTPDDKYGGNISRADAKAMIVRSQLARPRQIPIAGRDYPRVLFGFKSESPTPAVLLACRESFDVGAAIYSRAFGSLGALPETWFNFEQDTLYLDDVSWGSSYYDYSHLVTVLRQSLSLDDLARIENLAVRRNTSSRAYAYWQDTTAVDEYAQAELGRTFKTLTPHVVHLTIVDGHYAHQDRTITERKRAAKQYLDLKYMNSISDSTFCWRVSGFRIDASLLRSGISYRGINSWKPQDRRKGYFPVEANSDQTLGGQGLDMVGFYVTSEYDYLYQGESDYAEYLDQDIWAGDSTAGDSFGEDGSDEDDFDDDGSDDDSLEGRGEGLLNLTPTIKVEVIVSAADEERLLREAYLFEKEHNKGCWYVNPVDPSDCDYCAGDEIDEAIESLR